MCFLKLFGNEEDANRECDKADVNKVEKEGKPERSIYDLLILQFGAVLDQRLARLVACLTS